ncbi:MAG: glycosyltransferase family 4 protein [Pseudobdellovibrionaceae bacterium]
MKVILDLNALTLKRRTGIGVYAAELSKALFHLKQIESLEGRVKFSRLNKIKQVQQAVPFMPIKPWPWVDELPFLFSKSSDTIYHGLDFRVPPFKSYLKVVSVPDLVEYEEGLVDPKFQAQGKKQIQAILKHNKPDLIITLSEFSKQKILQYFPEYKNKIEVTYLGCDHLPQASDLKADPAIDKKLAHENYLLFVSTLEKRKNVVRIIESFEILKSSTDTPPNLKLFLVGGPGFDYENIKNKIDQSKYSQDIVQFSYLPQKEIPYFYKYAKAFVFPSLYEGFGIPAFEALRMGCPLVTSSTGALSEITQNCAFHANPLDAQSIADNIRLALLDEKSKQDNISAGYKHVQNFTWQACAQQTLEVYGNLLAR